MVAPFNSSIASLQRPDGVIEWTTGIYSSRLGVAALAGDPMLEGPGAPLTLRGRAVDRPTNCPNCGAPHEPVRCSYCLTPSR